MYKVYQVKGTNGDNLRVLRGEKVEPQLANIDGAT